MFTKNEAVEGFKRGWQEMLRGIWLLIPYGLMIILYLTGNNDVTNYRSTH